MLICAVNNVNFCSGRCVNNGRVARKAEKTKKQMENIIAFKFNAGNETEKNWGLAEDNFEKEVSQNDPAINGIIGKRCDHIFSQEDLDKIAEELSVAR